VGLGFWLLLALDLAVPLGLFIGRNWLKASIERSVQHRFDARLEALRADFRKSEEELKSDLRVKEGQMSALRDGVLSGRAQRQALLDKRRLDAVDGLWTGLMVLAPFAGVSRVMAAINFDAAASEALRNLDLRKFFQTITGDHAANLKQLSENRAKSEQPFVSPLAWAYFHSYQTIVLSAYIRAKTLELGLATPRKLFADEPIKNLLKAALPHQSEYIDTYGASGYHFLLEELEKNLLAELQKMLRGEEQDQEGLAQAAKIMKMADAVAAQNKKEPEIEAAAGIRAEGVFHF
jgi:hypothetical protein